MFQHKGNKLLGKRLSEDPQYAYHILTFILPYLNDSDFLRCAQVCPLWGEILEETGRAKLKYVTPCENHITTILENYGEEIYALDLSSITWPSTYAHIFSRLTSLKKLIVNLEILRSFPEINPNVEILELKNVFSKYLLRRVGEQFPNLIKLSIYFPSKEKIINNSIYFPSKEKIINTPLLDFRNSKKLKYLQLNLNFEGCEWEYELFRKKIKWYNFLLHSNLKFNKYRQRDWIKTEKMMVNNFAQLRIILDNDIIETLDPTAGLRLPNTVCMCVDILRVQYDRILNASPKYLSRIFRNFLGFLNTIFWSTFGRLLFQTSLDDLWPLENPEIVINTIYPKMEHLDLKERYWLIAFKNDIILRGVIDYLLIPKLKSELFWTLKYKDFPLESGYFLLEVTDYSMSLSLPLEITEPTIHPYVVKVKFDLFAKYLNDSFNIKVMIEEILAFEESCPLCQVQCLNKRRTKALPVLFEKIKSLF